MGHSDVNQIMEKRLEAILPVDFPIDFDNVLFTPEDGTSFVSLRTENIFTETKAISCRRKTYLSTITIFTPKNEGTKENDELVDTIESGFIPYQVGDFYCRKSTIRRIGENENWYQQRVLIESEYDNRS